MDSYSIEDIELLRKKSGLSYQEAVALLDYHNGDVARALIDLEKSGRLKDNVSEAAPDKEKHLYSSNANSDFGKKAIAFFQKLYRKRIKIQKDKTPILNISVLFGGICLLLAPHITIGGIIVSMILGYKFSFSPMDSDFSNSSLEKMVRNAAQNARNSVSSVMQNFKGEQTNQSISHSVSTDKPSPAAEIHQSVSPEAADQKSSSTAKAEDPAQELKEQTEEIEKTLDSFFESNPAATSYRSAYSAAASSVPTLQVPVQAETRDGTVEIGEDKDGYSSVTIG